MRHTWSSWDYHALCEDCEWEVYSRNSIGIAAQHHDRTGHTVNIDVIGSICYASEKENKRIKELKDS